MTCAHAFKESGGRWCYRDSFGESREIPLGSVTDDPKAMELAECGESLESVRIPGTYAEVTATSYRVDLSPDAVVYAVVVETWEDGYCDVRTYFHDCPEDAAETLEDIYRCERDA